MNSSEKTPRVLVVEDEFMVADMLRSILEDLGIEVVGPALNLEEGLMLAERENLDAAILDVNLRGQTIHPIADVLTARSVPYALATGYHGEIVEGLNGRAILPKPYAEGDVAAVLERLCASRATG